MGKIKIDNKWILILYFGISFLTLVIYGNRSIFVASILSFILIKRSKYKVVWLTLAILCTIGLIIFMKGDSSLGRLLVYKVSFSIFRDNWFFGCGLGEFGRVYLLEQANYFSKANFNQKELLLADNTIFAFNDWFQLICETGIFGVISIFLFCYTLWKLNNFLNEARFFWPKVIFFTILISALFTHVFEKQYIVMFLITVFFCSVFNKIDNEKIMSNLRLIFTMILIWGVISEAKFIYQESKLTAGINLSNSGQFYLSNLILGELRDSNDCNTECLFFYSRNCVKLDKIDEALHTMLKVKQQASNSMYYSLLADIYLAKNNFAESERNLIQAIHMVPNRFEERYKLLELYQQKEDPINSSKVASAIVNLEVKVNSDRIHFIKQYCNQILNRD